MRADNILLRLLTTITVECHNLLSPVQAGNVCRSNKIKHCLVNKHFHVWTPCLIVFDRVWYNLNVDKHLIKHKTFCKTFFSFDGDQTCLIPFGHSVQHQHVWSPNNVWSCLVAKHFPFGQGFSKHMSLEEEEFVERSSSISHHSWCVRVQNLQMPKHFCVPCLPR